MSEEVAQVDANLAEITRLNTTITDLRRHMEQMRKALAAERRARQMVEADNVGLLCVLDVLGRAGDLASVRGVVATAVARAHPGAPILAVFDAARAFRRAYLICEYASSLDESVDLYEEVDAAQAALFAAVEAIDGPMVYDAKGK